MLGCPRAGGHLEQPVALFTQNDVSSRFGHPAQSHGRDRDATPLAMFVIPCALDKRETHGIVFPTLEQNVNAVATVNREPSARACSFRNLLNDWISLSPRRHEHFKHIERWNATRYEVAPTKLGETFSHASCNF
jgi:hypothetical protein